MNVGNNCSDVDQSSHPLVSPRAGDRGFAVGVTDNDSGTTDPPQRALQRGKVVRIAVETVLNRDDFVTVGLQSGDDLAEKEPSAQRPWQKTMLGFGGDIVRCPIFG